MSKPIAPKAGRPDAIIVEANYDLRDKISVPLNALLSKERIQAGQEEMDKGRGRLQARCLQDLDMLKTLSKTLEFESRGDSRAFYHMQNCALRIKSTAGMVGFPIATSLAESLYHFLRVADGMTNPAIIHIIRSHVEAINAIFSERRVGADDPLGKRVLQELQQVTQSYLDAIKPSKTPKKQ